MSFSDGLDGQPEYEPSQDRTAQQGSLDTLLLESLIHHLIEKGVFTGNDALSIVQTVAEVKCSQLDEEAVRSDPELSILRRLYRSFDALRGSASREPDGENVRVPP